MSVATKKRETDRAVRRRRALLKLKRELQYAGPDDERWRDACLALADVLGYSVEPNHHRIITSTAYHRGRRRDLLLGHRGLGKSTTGTIVPAIKFALEDPNVRVLFTSATDGAAQEFLKETRIHLQTNEDLVEMFGPFFESDGGHGVVGRYRDGYATIAQRTQLHLREPTFLSIGIGGQMASRHFDVVFADDLVVEKNARTAGQREVIRSWHDNTLLGALTPRCYLLYRGTCYQPGDLYDDLWKGREDEKVGVLEDVTTVLPLVENYDDPWDQWVSTSPDRFPQEVCVQLRKEMGAYPFLSQMQQDTRGGDGIIFSAADFRWYHDDDRPPLDQMVTWQFFDLAARKRDKNDFFAGCTIGVWTCGENPAWGAQPGDVRIYVLDLVRERAGTKRQRALILEAAEKWRPIQAGVEAVAHQAGTADEVAESTILPVVPVELKGPMEGDKVARARRVSPKVEGHQVYFPMDDTVAGVLCRPLIRELSQFPDGDHDDTVDAFVGAITLAMYSKPNAAQPVSKDPRDFDQDGLLADYD